MAQAKPIETIQVETTDDPNKYVVPSQSRKDMDYTVIDYGEQGGLTCDCYAGQRGTFCKHIKAVMMSLSYKERHKEGVVITEAQHRAKKPRAVTKNGYRLDEVISAMHKEVRLGNEEMAVFWAMEASTIAPGYTWKRVVIQASEDVGFADPEAVRTAISLAQGWDFCKWMSRFFVDPDPLVHAVMVLSRAKKSTEVDDLKVLTQLRVKHGWRPPVPEYAVDAHTARGKELGRTDWRLFYDFRKVYLDKEGSYMKKLRAEYPDLVGKGEEDETNKSITAEQD